MALHCDSSVVYYLAAVVMREEIRVRVYIEKGFFFSGVGGLWESGVVLEWLELWALAHEEE